MKRTEAFLFVRRTGCACWRTRRRGSRTRTSPSSASRSGTRLADPSATASPSLGRFILSSLSRQRSHPKSRFFVMTLKKYCFSPSHRFLKLSTGYFCFPKLCFKDDRQAGDALFGHGTVPLRRCAGPGEEPDRGRGPRLHLSDATVPGEIKIFERVGLSDNAAHYDTDKNMYM